jgi:hypothetical protein
MFNLWNLLTLSVRMCTFWGGGGGLFGGGGGGGGGSSQTTTDIPEWLKPYVTFGLEEAQGLYKGAGPEYFPGQTYVSPSGQTTQALGLAEQRALAGSPLQRAALQQQAGTVGGQYLGVNPYLSQALKAGQAEATQAYFDAIKGGRSGAVAAGRMGSGAQQQMEGRAEQNLATALSQQAGQLAYQNYATERGRQEAAAGLAPSLAASEYADINQLLQTGKAGEAYQQAALEADVARFNFAQQKPYEKLSSYLGAVYGAPVPMQQTTTQETDSGGGKIICTAMNQAYGFGSFRNAVWLKYSQEKLTKEHEVGYHAMFLPLVKISYKMGNKWYNKAVRTVLEHLVKHRTKDIYQESKGKRRDTLGRIYRNIFEPLCYLVGKIKGVK